MWLFSDGSKFNLRALKFLGSLPPAADCLYYWGPKYLLRPWGVCICTHAKVAHAHNGNYALSIRVGNPRLRLCFTPVLISKTLDLELLIVKNVLKFLLEKSTLVPPSS